MFKSVLSTAVVSKGFDGAPAIRFVKNDAGDTVIAEFSVFTSVFDSKAENQKRFVSIRVKAYGKLAERIEKMKVKEGSTLNISGSLDEERYEKDGKTVRYNIVIVDGIEYAGGGSGKKAEGDSGEAKPAAAKNSDDEFVDDDLPF